MLKRRLKFVGKCLLWIIVVMVVFLLVERFRGQLALASFKRAMIAKGEKLSPQDFVQSVSEADNGAPAAIAAIERLQDGRALPNNRPPRMKVVNSGRAIVGFRENNWVEQGTYRDGEWIDETVTNDWSQIAADLETNQTTLNEIRVALEKPVLNNLCDLSQGLEMKFSKLGPAKSVTHWFGSAIGLTLHEGRNGDAKVWLEAQIRLPSLLSDDPVIISHLVRHAIASIAQTDTWEALQADGWTDNDLATLQKAWESQNFAATTARAFEGERVYCLVSAGQLWESNQKTYDYFFGEYSGLISGLFGQYEQETWSQKWIEFIPFTDEFKEWWRKQIYCRVWRFSWSHQAQLREQKSVDQLIEEMRRGVKSGSYQQILPDLEAFIAGTARKNFYDRLRYPGLDAVSSLSRIPFRAMKAETDRSMTIAAIALKRYSLRHGALPASLDALVPELLSQVPTDFMDGKPVRYRRNEDGSFTLYSVGEDGKDDGGDQSLPQNSKSSSRALWTRRDYVWPAPATAEEIEDYRKESSKN